MHWRGGDDNEYQFHFTAGRLEFDQSVFASARVACDSTPNKGSIIRDIRITPKESMRVGYSDKMSKERSIAWAPIAQESTGSLFRSMWFWAFAANASIVLILFICIIVGLRSKVRAREPQ